MVKSNRRYTKVKRGKRKTLRKTNRNTRRKKQRNVSRNKKGGLFFSETREKRRTIQNKVRQLTDSYKQKICAEDDPVSKMIDGCKSDSPIYDKFMTNYNSSWAKLKALRPGRQKEILEKRLADYRKLQEQVKALIDNPETTPEQKKTLEDKQGIIEAVIQKCESDDAGDDWTLDEAIEPANGAYINKVRDSLKTLDETLVKNIKDFEIEVLEIIENPINLGQLRRLKITEKMNNILKDGFVTSFVWEAECTKIPDASKLKGTCMESIKNPLQSAYKKLYDFFDKYIKSISKLKNSTSSRVLTELKSFNTEKLELLGKSEKDIKEVYLKAKRLHTEYKISINLDDYKKLLLNIRETLGSNASGLTISIQTERLLETAGNSGNRLIKELKEKEVNLENYFKLLRHLVPTDIKCTIDIFDIYQTNPLNKDGSIATGMAKGVGGLVVGTGSLASQVVTNALSLLPGFNRGLGGMKIHNPMNDVNALHDKLRGTIKNMSCGELVSSQADNELSKRCKGRDGRNFNCLLPDTIIISLSIFFENTEDENKYIKENVEHYSKFYTDDKANIFSTLNNKKEDPYELLKQYKSQVKDVQVGEEYQSVRKQMMASEGVQAFLRLNKSTAQNIKWGDHNIEDSQVVSCMELLSYIIDQKVKSTDRFIIPGISASNRRGRPGDGGQWHQPTEGWPVREIGDLIDFDSVREMSVQDELEEAAATMLQNAFSYPEVIPDGNSPGDEITLFGPTDEPFKRVIPSPPSGKTRYGGKEIPSTEFMVYAPYKGISPYDKIIILEKPPGPLHQDPSSSQLEAKESVSWDVMQQQKERERRMEEERQFSEAALMRRERELEEKKMQKRAEIEKDFPGYLEKKYLIPHINNLLGILVGKDDLPLSKIPTTLKEYVIKLKGVIETVKHIDYNTKRAKARSLDDQYEILSRIYKKLVSNIEDYDWSFLEERSKETKYNIKMMRDEVIHYLSNKKGEIWPKTELYKKSVAEDAKRAEKRAAESAKRVEADKVRRAQKEKVQELIKARKYKEAERLLAKLERNGGGFRGGGRGEDEYIEPYEAYLSNPDNPENMKRAIDDYINMKEFRKGKTIDENDDLIVNGPFIIIQGSDIRRIDCPLNLGKEDVNGVTDKVRRLSIKECEDYFDWSQLRGEKEKRNSIMQSLSEKEESGSVKLLEAISRYTFNEMVMNGLKEGKFETGDLERKMQAQSNTIWEFKDAEKGVEESKKIVKVLEDYKKINESSGETLGISLEEFCKELDEDRKPRLEIDKSELNKKQDEIQKELENKKQKFFEIIDRVQDHGVIGFVNKKDGLRFNMTDDGCWYGYQHWISPDDREKESCKPLKILTEHNVGYWREIGDATYDRFRYDSVTGAKLYDVKENISSCQKRSQEFIDQLIYKKNKKIEDIKQDYENPDVLLSSESFKTKCLELQEMYSILESVGITDDTQKDVQKSMREMESKILPLTKDKEDKGAEGGGSGIKFKYHSPFIKVVENGLSDKIPYGSIFIGVPLKFMSEELRKTIDEQDNQIPDLSREPVTFSEKGNQNVTWLSNLAVIHPTQTQRNALSEDSSIPFELSSNQEIILLPPDIVINLGGEDGIRQKERWRPLTYNFWDKLKSYINYLKNNVFARYLKSYLTAKIGQIVGTLIVVAVLSFIFPIAIPFILPFIGSASKNIGSLFGLFNNSQGGGGYNNIKINYLSNKNIIKDKKLIKDKNKITKKRKGKTRNRKKITTKHKKSKRYYK